jgi:hypothetical protein
MPLTYLLPVASVTQCVIGRHEGMAWMSDDFAAPDEFWTENS